MLDGLFLLFIRFFFLLIIAGVLLRVLTMGVLEPLRIDSFLVICVNFFFIRKTLVLRRTHLQKNYFKRLIFSIWILGIWEISFFQIFYEKLSRNWKIFWNFQLTWPNKKSFTAAIITNWNKELHITINYLISVMQTIDTWYILNFVKEKNFFLSFQTQYKLSHKGFVLNSDKVNKF